METPGSVGHESSAARAGPAPPVLVLSLDTLLQSWGCCWVSVVARAGSTTVTTLITRLLLLLISLQWILLTSRTRTRLQVRFKSPSPVTWSSTTDQLTLLYSKLLTRLFALTLIWYLYSLRSKANIFLRLVSSSGEWLWAARMWMLWHGETVRLVQDHVTPLHPPPPLSTQHWQIVLGEIFSAATIFFSTKCRLRSSIKTML